MTLTLNLAPPVDLVDQPITLRMRAFHRVRALVNRRPFRLRNAAPLVSFTFDDVPESAVSNGARLLEQAGCRGTFFVATSQLSRTTANWRVAGREDVACLAAGGHEIGLHTHDHRPLAHTSRRAFASDMVRASGILASLAKGAVIENFAYPYGFSDLAHDQALVHRARSCRTMEPGLNSGLVDLNFLRSYGFGVTLHATAALDDLLDRTVAANGWLLLTGHDVTDRPSPFGCTPALFGYAVEQALRRGLTVATVAAALDACGVETCGKTATVP